MAEKEKAQQAAGTASAHAQQREAAPNSPLGIGWAETEITPPQPSLITGMFHARLSEGVLDPLIATAWALESGEEQAIFVSCDLVTISDELRDEVRSRLRDRVDGLDPMKVVLHATHTHSGPEIRVPSATAGHTSVGGTGVELDAMPVEAYISFAGERIASAVVQAWKRRTPGGVAFGLGHAVLGRNRRWVRADGSVTKYGLEEPAVSDSFRHVEGYEDHSVNVLAAYDSEGVLTGVVVNVPCPSQLSESEFSLSADYWHEARQEIRRRFGEHLYILPQCSAAGELCPFLLYEQTAHDRMLKLKGSSARLEMAQRIADELGGILPYIGQTIDWSPSLRHEVIRMELAANRLTEADARDARQEADKWRRVYEEELRKLERDPSLRQSPRWYVAASEAYRRQHWNLNVAHRYERQKKVAAHPVELHALRLGDIAFASNPFELYVDFGVQIKVRSPAIQTFVVQLAGGGTYLPSPRSMSGGGYGSIPASNPVGPEGGQQIVDRTVETLRSFWNGE